MEEKTELEKRLEKKLEQPRTRVYREKWSTCLHPSESVKYLGDIGSASLYECGDCGLTMGRAA